MTMVVPDINLSTLSPIIHKFVKKGSRIYTDKFVGYNSLTDSEYSHAVVCHGRNNYVNGDVHTNGIEGFWGHFKRMISGIYHFCSHDHLQDYLNEEVFRWNTRRHSETDRFLDMFTHATQIVRQTDLKLCGNHRSILRYSRKGRLCLKRNPISDIGYADMGNKCIREYAT